MSLDGLRFLITAGPTRESWDPVRYLTNRSSGKTGFVIAGEARKRGARVTLVSSIRPGKCDSGIRNIEIESCLDMFEAVREHFKDCDVFIASAAVADFRPVKSEQKIKKNGEIPSIKLKKNPDILKWAGENRNRQLLVGFSLSDSIDTSEAREKMKKKNCQVMIANSVKNMASARKTFTAIDEEGEKAYRNLSLKETAGVILNLCQKAIKNT